MDMGYWDPLPGPYQCQYQYLECWTDVFLQLQMTSLELCNFDSEDLDEQEKRDIYFRGKMNKMPNHLLGTSEHSNY